MPWKTTGARTERLYNGWSQVSATERLHGILPPVVESVLGSFFVALVFL